MNKFAFSEMRGREIGLRLFIDAEVEDFDKQASAGEALPEEQTDYVQSLVDDLAYHQQQQKIAHNNGAYTILTNIAEALQDPQFNKEALLQEVAVTMDKIATVSFAAANDEEDEALFGRMVKGAATMIAHLYERPLDEEIVQIAANHVAETLAPQA